MLCHLVTHGAERGISGGHLSGEQRAKRLILELEYAVVVSDKYGIQYTPLKPQLIICS